MKEGSPLFLEVGMKPKAFDAMLERLHDQEREVLGEKGAVYARRGDRLSNFKDAGRALHKHPAIALHGMMLKHQVALNDFMEDLGSGKPVSEAEWLEKIVDSRNYLALMLACLIDGGEVKDF